RLLTTATCSLPLHDALPISTLRRRDRHELEPRVSEDGRLRVRQALEARQRGYGRRLRLNVCEQRDVVIELLAAVVEVGRQLRRPDRKSTRLNSSHVKISYAV